MDRKVSLDNESMELEFDDCTSLDISLKNSASLTIRIANFSNAENIKISAEVGSNCYLNVIYADFSKQNIHLVSNVNLNDFGAVCDWKLASLADKNYNKVFDVSFVHNKGKTIASMDNYGVAKDESKIVFTGCNHIINGAKNSNTKQNAKIIVFDEKSNGVASPTLRIDENEVKASHGAVVGQLNNEHMFYLMSRGLTRKEAREIITLGYLEPISRYFSDSYKEKISNVIRGSL